MSQGADYKRLYRLSLWLSLYLSLAGALGWLLTGSPSPILVAATSLPAALLDPMRLRRLLILASAIYLGSLGPRCLLFAAPALLLAPILYAGEPDRSGWSMPRLPLGSSAAKAALHILVFSAAALVYPSILHSLVLALASLFVLSLKDYVSLRRAELEVIHAPKNTTVGSSPSMVLSIGGIDEETWVVVFAGETVSVTRVGNRGGLVRVPLEADLVGRHHVRVVVFVCGRWCFGKRLLLEDVHEYNVVPAPFAPEDELVGLLELIRGLREGSGGAGLEAELYQLVRGAPRPQAMSALPTTETLVGIGGVISLVLEKAYAEAVLAGSGRRARIGEYCGARLYQPGDDVRSIHWKKSVSLGELVVKERFAGSGTGGLGHAGKVVIVDLSSTSLSELSRIVGSLVDTVREVVVNAPNEGLAAVLYAGGSLLVLRGPSVSVAEAIFKALREGLLPQGYYSYESTAVEPPRPIVEALTSPSVRAARGPAGIIAETINVYAKGIVSVIEDATGTQRRGVEILVIHGRSSVLRNTVLERMLREKGFRTVRLCVAKIGDGQRTEG